MKNRYIFALTAALALALGGCTDMLDIPQKSVVDVNNFYRTDADAAEAATYMWAGFSTAVGNAGMFKTLLDDDSWCGGGNRNDNAAMEELNEFTFTTQNGGLRDYFSALYTLIYRANLIIENFTPDSDVKKNAIAEAKFMRAYSYFELVTLWGTPSLVTQTAKSDADYKQPNGDAAQIWALIETDLTEAIDSGALPQKAAMDDKVSHVARHAAQAMLGKALVFQKKYADAAEVLDEVIDSGLYDLYDGEYQNILRTVADFNRENLLEVNKVSDENNAFYNMSFANIMWGWRNDKFDDPFFALAGMQGFTTTGWGFWNPTRSLYDAFVAREGADGYRLTSAIKTYEQVQAMVAGLKIGDGKSLYGHEGLFMWKQRMTTTESPMMSFGFAYDNNMRVLRLAEVLLLAAEAHLNGGDAGKALTYVNRVRSRARLEYLAALTMDDLKIEKRLELCFEGVRFQDLVRWGDAATALAGKGKAVPSFGHDGKGNFGAFTSFSNPGAGFVAGKHELMPFPFTETSVNDRIVQNPNWN